VTISAAAERRILLALATFAMAWVIVRARVQAITIDEAVTYVNFVSPRVPTWWTPHANNHVLNSALMRIFSRAFGPSNLTVRSGALIGAAIFILASYFLTALIDQDFLLRVSLFVCLVFNPFIFDFLVAARGYSLASGFLLSAICMVAYAKKPDATENARSLDRACFLASVCIALSFLSNFPFAFVDAATIGILYLWASGGGSLKTRLRLGVAGFLPVLLAAGALAPLLLQWKEPLTYGAKSLSETLQSLYEPSFYEINPTLNELIFIDVPAVLVTLFVVFGTWQAALIFIHWRSLRNSAGRWSLAFTAVPIVAVTAALFMHEILFRLTRTPMPKDRTGIYIVVLGTLFLGAMAAVPISTRAGDLTRRGLTILMVATGSYFLLCLRVSYFKEWNFDSDVDKVYTVLADYNHACGLKDVAVNWRYDGSLNYYRTISGRETFLEFPFVGGYPAGKRAYVIYQPDDRNFVTDHALSPVYEAPSGAVIALDPAVVPPPGESPCPLTLPDPSK
jgi:hypothetical protein